MPAEHLNLTIDAGEDFPMEIVYSDNETGDPIDITGCSAAMMIRRSPEDVSPVVNISTTNGGISIDGPAGKLSCLVRKSATSALCIGNTKTQSQYDLELTSPGGLVTPLLYGTVTSRPNITR